MPGPPVPKQSFKKGAGGRGGYTPEQVKQWQDAVRIIAANAMQIQDQDCTEGPLRAELEFILPDRRRRDIDNLTKAVFDGMTGVVFYDDDQVVALHAYKIYQDEMPQGSVPEGVSVYIHEH